MAERSAFESPRPTSPRSPSLTGRRPRLWWAAAGVTAGIVLGAVSLGWTAADRAPQSADAGVARPAVAVAIEPHRWIAEQLLGVDADVHVAIPAGSSCCGHQPTDFAVNQLASAAIYFRAGIPAEDAPWLERGVVPRVGMVVDLSATLGPDAGDAHAWTSPSTIREHARAMATTLLGHPAFDAIDDAVIERRFARLEAELDALVARTETRLRPLAGHRIWVDHPAWSRLAREHGIEQVVIDADGVTVNDQRIDALLRDAADTQVRHVFVQPQHPGRIARRIADAIDADVVVLDPFERNPIDGIDRAVDAFVVAINASRDAGHDGPARPAHRARLARPATP